MHIPCRRIRVYIRCIARVIISYRLERPLSLSLARARALFVRHSRSDSPLRDELTYYRATATRRDASKQRGSKFSGAGWRVGGGGGGG